MFWNTISIILALLAMQTALPSSITTEVSVTKQQTLLDFGETDTSEWRVINDGVMGGVSQSNIRRTDQNTGMFTGMLSLENNGGFASVQAVIGRRDLSAYSGLEIRVRGDGRAYQLRLRADDRFDGVAYRALFETTANEWRTVYIAFDQFVPTFRGRILTDAPPLDVTRISQVAFLLADKTAGPFSLEIDFVRTGNVRSPDK